MSTASPSVEGNASLGTSGMISPRHLRSRSQSISSDRPSTIGLGLVLPPVSVSPEASYIACSAASSIITNDHDSHADAWYDQNGIEPASETATVSAQALQLVNGFLDQLLFNFLQMSKSTSLSALRPAVVEVLKPKLAKDAIGNADEELREYLGASDEDDYVQTLATGLKRDWDLELVWKRTRLRCMVYSSLGDMEEEDEDSYMEEGNLEMEDGGDLSASISPAVAIFLTSVIEYMGELTLTVAGQAAYQRVRNKIERELREGSRDASRPADQILVTEADMERVALDRTLGRLWRGWKKRMRTPAIDVAGRPFAKILSSLSKQDQATPGHDVSEHDVLGIRRPASNVLDNEQRRSIDHSEPVILEDVQAADVPLPIGENDIDEIEVPGLVHHSDDDDDDDADDELDEREKKILKRPKSLTLTAYSIFANGLPTPNRSQPHTPTVTTRKRSLSMPVPETPHFFPKTRKQTQAPEPGSEAPHGTEEESPSHAQVQSTTDNLKPVVDSGDAAHVDAGVAGTDGGHTFERDRDGGAVAYEQAEILTSARVSITGSVHSADSDMKSTSRAGKRSSSVHSARIIDVLSSRSPAAQSPARSRPESVHQIDAAPRVSSSEVGSASAPSPAITAEVADEKPGRPADSAAALAITSEKHSEVNDVIASSGEEVDPPQRPAQVPQGLARRSPEMPTAPLAAAAVEPALISTTLNRKKGPPIRINTTAQAQSSLDQPPFSARSVSLPASPAMAAVEDPSAPDVPRKTPAHAAKQSPKSESKSLLAIERTKTQESDESTLPQQSSSNARQIHTAASSVSSGGSRRKPVRTSEDGSDMARNFEELIQSNQTITYTLTPENMRDMDSKPKIDSPVMTKFARRKSEDARAHVSPKASPIVAQSAAGRLPSPRLPPTPASPKASDPREVGKPSGSAPRAPTSLNVSTARDNGHLPREARVPADTTSDFAEFIKSTGPPGENAVYSVPKLGLPVSPGRNHREARRVSTASSVNRSRYQPRDAVVDSRADNSDLIDFIRQGPPIAASNHRIPRHVAPFRTTMDSDQMSGAIGGKAIDANIPDIRNSQASTNMTDVSMPSMHSSVNSKSALLRNKAAAAPNRIFDDEDMMPKRKTRRVRDPYAIDFSDDEETGAELEDTVAETPRIPAKKEESLAEFLRNCEPPAAPPSSSPRMPKKKASAPTLMGRFARGSKDKDRDSISLKGGVEPRNSPVRNGTRGYIPIQVNMPAGYDMYGPTENRPSESRARVPSIASATASRVPMKKFEPREPVTTRSQTADLAAFLRDSAPPPNNAPVVIDQSRQEEGGGISKMFGRRKKSLAY